MENIKHDLFDIIKEITHEMASEYIRICKRAKDDPGTAGDQGEENWAKLLREWLPPIYTIVTKGRIISSKGNVSHQIDVIVLDECYPKKLIDKKLYLAAGVIAAFECKTTLNAAHIKKATENCIEIKKMYDIDNSSIYSELHSPIVYGILAHSHSWKKPKSKPNSNIEKSLFESDKRFINHPRYQLDLVCIADLSFWSSIVSMYFMETFQANPKQGIKSRLYELQVNTSFINYNDKKALSDITSIGSLISILCRKLGWKHKYLRDLAEYYQISEIEGEGNGIIRNWTYEVFSQTIQEEICNDTLRKKHSASKWNEWGYTFV